MLRSGASRLWRLHALRSLTSTAVATTALSSCATPCHRSLHSSTPCRSPRDVSATLAADLHRLIHHDRVVLFLTGTPTQPRCRFTAMLTDVMEQLGVHYSYYNILDDEEVCEGLKSYSDWPTYPQVYIDGELIGGYDVCKDMMLSGALTRLLKDKSLV